MGVLPILLLVLAAVVVVAFVLLLLLLDARWRQRVLQARVSTLETELASGTPSSGRAAPAPAIAAPATPATRAATSSRPAARPAMPAAGGSPARMVADRQSAAPGRPAPVRPVPGTEEMFQLDRGLDAGPAWTGALRSFLFGGDTLVRVGVVILFFGFSFLLSYAAQEGWFPIELRVLTAAGAGGALFALGWRLRDARREYALALQGCGAGVVYLTAFAAVSFYDVIGAGAGLGVMILWWC